MAEHGLVEVSAEEKGGLVFVTQDDPVSKGALENLPEMFDPKQAFFSHSEFTDEANWKLLAETSMEGYHIKHLHNKTFYPYGLDNINIVETFGPNSRIIFPFRRIEKLRDIPEEDRNIQGMVTSVYQLFPNVHVTVLSNHSQLIILEPLSPTKTKFVIYRMQNLKPDGSPIDLEIAVKDANFVKDTGLEEDRDAAVTIQENLETEANTHFTFGLFEKAIVHFHKILAENINRLN